MDHTHHRIDQNSGFCEATGIFHSKRARISLPSTPQLSLPAFLQQQSCGNSTSTAYIDFSDRSSISYAQLHGHIKAVAAGLTLLLGVQKGDVLLLLAPNSIHFVIFLQAALSIGAVITTSNPLSLPVEISRQAVQCATKFIATTAALVHKTHHCPGGQLSFYRNQMLLAIQTYRVTNLPLVPPVLLALAKSSLVEKYDLSSLREISVGAAPVSKDLVMTFKARFPAIVVLQGYALTESTAVGATSLTAEESQEFSSTGLLAPNTEAKIVDVDSGNPLPPNHSGEIWLRGPTIMQGYHGQPEATASTVDKEGWLRTGDLGYINSNGFFIIIDRLKELIKYKGFQVAPAELEDVLLSHPLIQDAAVVPYADEEAGQIPFAYVVLASGAKLSAAEAINFVAERVAPYKKIRKVSFVRSIPKTPSGKILRRELIAKAGSKL
ncbi:hypothetical protein GOP47_0006422 [Adiantum capillus-veneris]|uniref:4-coumarate--CoA ligase n=1 Tax=Adiantum capillus-veneris TaxID=13818 RepID=A0A9D4V2V0_ADICA|nr:hypothetical protein GOP47_0006422 [Adiantum capillus-veneris]